MGKQGRSDEQQAKRQLSSKIQVAVLLESSARMCGARFRCCRCRRKLSFRVIQIKGLESKVKDRRELAVDESYKLGRPVSQAIGVRPSCRNSCHYCSIDCLAPLGADGFSAFVCPQQRVICCIELCIVLSGSGQLVPAVDTGRHLIAPGGLPISLSIQHLGHSAVWKASCHW